MYLLHIASLEKKMKVTLNDLLVKSIATTLEVLLIIIIIFLI